jgi:hypothetical protein
VATLVPELRFGDQVVGTTMGERFEVKAFAGAGGMGRVYRALDRTTGGTVAIKLLPYDGDAARFAREAEVLATMDHPGVVRYLAHGTTPEGTRYLAMEWFHGEDLASRLVDGTLSVGETLEVARQVAESLGATHRHGIVHRDLKPANLFLVGGRLDTIKLLDFGVARSLTDVDLTATGVLVGTPAYMAPEQVRGDAVDPRADVYGLGAVLFTCLMGHAPFRGAHHLAILAKVMLEPPPQIRELCPDVPPELEELIRRMLAKNPAERPADGAALARELSLLGETDGASAARIHAAVSAREQRVACVVLCARASSKDPTVTEHGNNDTEERVQRAVEERGGAIQPLAKGAWVITIPSAASPREQAMRAARCALALAAIRPNAPLFVSTGRVLVTGVHRVGEVIDRAAEALVQARGTTEGGAVRVDRATAELLDGPFRITGEGEWRSIVDEEETTAPVRLLLGKPTRCFGREPQLAMLTAMLASSAEQPRACAVLVTAPPGLGKTHLIQELLRTTAAAGPDLDVLFASGEPLRTASPFGLAAQILRRAAGMLESDPSRERANKLAALVTRDFDDTEALGTRELLGEICGVPTSREAASPALRAARADVAIMADAVRETWRQWIAARARRKTLLLIIEDLHWADAASIRLIEAALGSLEDRPILLLATGRPGGGAVLSDAFRSHGLVEITLAPLSVQASERLIRSALGDAATETIGHTLARRAGGHPFHLEELVRAVAAGRGPEALPDSVLGMVQARFDDLDTTGRRLLRAASVFGETFWSGGVAALMGDDVPPEEARRVLAKLAEREVITEQRSSKWTGEQEYRFRHALLRDAAYATLADSDRVRAHRRAAAWLEEIGEADPAVLAEHYDRGASADRALHFLRQAATQALQRNDFERAMSHATRARSLGPDNSAEAALSVIEAEVLYWRGDLAAAAVRAGGAAERLPPGTHEWFDAVSVAMGALGQLGQNDAVAIWLADAARVTSAAESRGEHLVTLCRGMTQLFWAHHGGGLKEVRAHLDRLAAESEPLDAFHAGWVHRVRGESAWLHEHDVERCFVELDASCGAFGRARAARALCLTRLNAASLAGWSGAPSRALELLGQSRAEAERLGAGFLVHYGKAVHGMLLAYAGEPAAAELAMRDALAAVAGSPRLTFVSHVVLGSLALERGDLDVVEASTRAAEAIVVAPELRPAALALAARLALARAQSDDALRLANHAARVESGCLDLDLMYGMAGHALAETHHRRGDDDAARAALTPVIRRLSAIASTIPSIEERRLFWHRPIANASIVRLGATLGVCGEDANL